MRYVIDRFEGDRAVVELEDGSMVSLPGAALPAGAREGDVVCVSVDPAETARQQGPAEGQDGTPAQKEKNGKMKRQGPLCGPFFLQAEFFICFSGNGMYNDRGSYRLESAFGRS